MSSKAIGILNLHYTPEMGMLTSTRSTASTSVYGRYAFMDFPLSNFTNSGIDRMAVLIKHHLRSIVQHCGEGHLYNQNSKLGGLSLLYDEPFATDPMYNHDINNLIENNWFIKSIPDSVDVVVIAPVHMIFKLDYRPYIEDHIKNNHKISIFYSKVKNAKDTFLNEQVVTINEKGLLTELNTNLGTKDEADIYMHTAIIDKEILRGLVNLGKKTSSLFSLLDVIKLISSEIPIYTYEYKGYIRCFDSLKHYLEYSREFLDINLQKEFFTKDWPIYTKTFDTPPAKYLDSAVVKNSFISNGSRIEGTVINSIIGRDVVIKAGVTIKDSVILTGSYISENTYLENVVCDKEARVIHKKEIIGTKENPQFIKRGDIV